MSKGGKRPKRLPASAVPEQPNRVPRRLPASHDVDGQSPLWRLSLLDRDHQGSWSWGIDEATLLKIVTLLREMESLTWTEIFNQQTGGKKRRGPRNKPIPVENLCKEAQNRLRELKLEEWDELFRFREGNMGRLWGVLTPEHPRVFYPIWWDADHRVCPGKDRD
ncbi:hypothetical protein [Nocardiopsis sp. B62]|uniref:hypothetical protein n=1 Tax=Nocardiopsis sp. B62 TaxID=2824874 RepID=UPI001B372AB7|nr:hypothetical protein [Nocardiopsis sp. B62]MBQ1081577.1 hypothetical protein [Nocardiopsis sp. B62]